MSYNSSDVSTKRQRIAMLAEQMPQTAFTSLAHHMDVVWLEQAYRQIRRDAAPGIDGVTWDHYEQQIQ